MVHFPPHPRLRGAGMLQRSTSTVSAPCAATPPTGCAGAPPTAVCIVRHAMLRAAPMGTLGDMTGVLEKIP